MTTRWEWIFRVDVFEVVVAVEPDRDKGEKTSTGCNCDHDGENRCRHADAQSPHG